MAGIRVARATGSAVLEVSGPAKPKLRSGPKTPAVNRTHQIRVPIRDPGCGAADRIRVERALPPINRVLPAYDPHVLGTPAVMQVSDRAGSSRVRTDES